MARDLCGFLRPDGKYCPLAPARCPGHVVREPLEATDVRVVGWWLLRALMRGEVDVRRAAAITALLRTLKGFGLSPEEEAENEREVLLEVELRGLIMHGMLPRDEEEWARARKRFSADALDHIVRAWELRHERDAGPLAHEGSSEFEVLSSE